MKKIILAVIIVIIVFVALAGTKGLQIFTLVSAGKSFAPPPETISTAIAHDEQWPDSLTAVGSVAAVQGVMLTPEVAGTVSQIIIESGTVVAKGDLIMRLDASTEEAQLRALEAQVELWKLEAARERQLWAAKATSKADLDSAEAALAQGLANADALRATIAKKSIRAPFAGSTGFRQINLGEAVDKGKALISVQSFSPLVGNFSLPQQQIGRLKVGMVVRLTVDTFPDKHFDGTLTTINPDLDPVTRSVGLQATFENPDSLLRSGMFARFEVMLPGEENVLTIPATSVLSAPYGDSVYVVEASTNAPGALVARQQFVSIGRARGDFVSVQKGLKAGQRVVNSGLFKLRNGMGVVENNDLKPKTDEKPRPPNS